MGWFGDRCDINCNVTNCKTCSIYNQNICKECDDGFYSGSNLSCIIVLHIQCATNAKVRVVTAARKIGQENSAIYHAHQTADSATSLTNRIVRCAEKHFTEEIVSMHAMQDVLKETD